jgi:selenocysteine-specific elongation factor
MRVIATAGHVDHGKSALLRALTGMEPDRWAEERRRGMTIDLGFAWMRLPSGDRLAFVDVPGHARFVPNMLAGVGPVPAVLFVVAADGGWMPQSAEHLAAIDALGISRGLLAVTRCDLADPGPAMAQATEMIGRSSLGAVRAVAVSAVTGAGLPELVGALGELAGSVPDPDPLAPVRIWVDRAFSITGAGTVVTGTLPAGRVRRGDELLVTPSLRPVKVRGMQSLGENATELTGVARAALNLRGADLGELARGMALVQPGRWTLTRLIDARITATTDDRDLPRLVTLHVGSARTPARVRPLDRGQATAGVSGGRPPGPALVHVRLALRDPLPLHVGERILVRDPGTANPHSRPSEDTSWPGVFGAVVLDVAPPPLRGRGVAAAAARELSGWPDQPAAVNLLRRHGLLRAADLIAMGVTEPAEPVAPGWLADREHWAVLGRRLADLTAAHATEHPLAAGLSADAARGALGLPDRRLVAALISPPLRLEAGLITSEPPAPAHTEPAGTAHDGAASRGAPGQLSPQLPPQLVAPITALLADLATNPFSAPEAARLRELGLDARSLAAAARHGAVLRIADQIVLAPDAALQAARVLAGLPQPFTAAQARMALATTRRTLIPLLEHLDRVGLTRRLPDDRRQAL